MSDKLFRWCVVILLAALAAAIYSHGQTGRFQELRSLQGSNRARLGTVDTKTGTIYLATGHWFKIEEGSYHEPGTTEK